MIWERIPLTYWEYFPKSDRMIEDFILEATQYCRIRRIKPATLGAYAVKDKTVFKRLTTNGNVGVQTIKRIQDYMAANPVATPTPEKDVA